MDWNSKDIGLYLQEKQYVDTVVIPLLPVAFGEEMKQAASQGEFIQLLGSHLERQFKGRLLLLPAISYLSHLDNETNIAVVQQWENVLKKEGFQHIFYLTSDALWRNNESALTGNVVWMPAIPLEHVEESYKHSIMEDQVKQLLNIFVHQWQTSK